jgi:hypothetical protein
MEVSMSLIDLIDRTADRFEAIIETESGQVHEIPTEDFGWQNRRWFGERFRLAHVERFRQPRFSVLHTVIFPHVMDPSPIFGFDIIASDTKVTGIFFDRSPTLACWGPMSDKTYGTERKRPDWGTIFSDHWIACRPSVSEAEEICDLACDVLCDYAKRVNGTCTPRVHDIIQAQNTYSLQQRKNVHTTTVIRKLLGEERGTHFINEILFPVIK